MVVGRTGARRRRLVVDPNVQLGDADADIGVAPSTPPRRQKSRKREDARTYSYGADRRNQLKTTDLIPKRVVSYLSVVACLLLGIWVLNYCAQNAAQWIERIGESGLEVFALRGQGSLASWFSSFLLIMTGLASLQIYALRQHRCDDYRGTYRMWLWMAGLFIVASINCVANLGEVASNLVQSVTNGPLTERPWIPLAIKLGALGILMARGLYEVRESRGSFALVVFVWVAYSVAAVLQLPETKQTIVSLSTDAVTGNCFLFGTASLLLAHLTYARYIFLQAHGLIAVRVKQQKTAKPKKKAKPAVRKKKATLKQTVSKKDASTNKSSSRTSSGSTASRTKSKTAVQKTAAQKTAAQKTAAQKTAAQKTAAQKTARKQKSSVAPQGNERPKSNNGEKSPSEVLREMAAASRAKEQTSHQAETEDDAGHGVIKMSKAQRRKQRKLEKQQRRAA